MTAPQKPLAQRPFAGWLILAATAASVCAALWWIGGHQAGGKDAGNSDEFTPLSSSRKPTKLVVPARGAYTGAYIDFGETEDNVTLEGIEEFEELAGKHQAIVAFSSYWGEKHFPQRPVDTIAAHGSIPLIFWSPWGPPYSEELMMVNGPDEYRLDNILAGKWNDYIDRWADAAHAFGQPMFVSLCNEMNGNWFPWSGAYYGGSKPVPGSNPVRYQGPETFKRAFRYIVDRVRARGARNVLWVFHVNNYSDPQEPWNTFAQYYPGSDYIDWLGLSAYGMLFPDGKWVDGKWVDSGRWLDFDAAAKTPYDELCRVDPNKPVMLTEWGVGEFPEKGDKGAWFNDAFGDMRQDYSRLRAAIYWHERWQNPKTLFYSNLKINSSPQAQAAYRRGVASPFWLDQPIYR